MAVVAVIAIVAGISYLAYMLLKGGQKQSSDIDNSIVEPSVRGTILTMSLGVDRHSPVIGYVGNTLVTKESTGGGGGKGGGGSTPKTTIYHQSGLHFISIGEGAELTRIVEGGKTIFDTVITPSSHPSGSALTASDGSPFRIYWGEDVQPIDSPLAALTGVTTRYPFITYIVWDRKRLGTSKVWPNLEYEVFIKTQQATLFGKDPIIDDTINPFNLAVNVTGLDRIFVDSDLGGYYTNESVITTVAAEGADVQVGYQLSGTINLVDFIGTVTAVSESGGTYTFRTQAPIPSAWYSQAGTLTFRSGTAKGVNPAAIIYQLLFETYPHGLGVNTASYNLTDLEAMFDYFVASGSVFPASVSIKSNKSIRDGLGMVLQDCGVTMGWDSETFQYRFTRMASTDSPTLIESEYFNMGDDGRIDSGYSVLDSSIKAYRFTDSNRKFKDSTLLVSDDGTTKYTGMPNVKKITMGTVRDLLTGSWVAAYRDRENFVRAVFKAKLSKEKAGLLIGGLFNFQGIEGNFRLMEKKIVPDNATVSANFIEDVYSEDTTFIEKEASGLFPGDSSGSEPDLDVVLIEVSRFTHQDQDGVYMVRVRNHPQIQGTIPYLSDSGVSYIQQEILNTYAVGGKLTQAIPADGAAIDVSAYEFDITGPDASAVSDLSAAADEDRWRSGEQLCLIGTELFFVRSISPTATPGEYSLGDLVRARLGTARQLHNIGDDIVIFLAADITILKATFMTAGADVYAKSVPFTQNDIQDISDISAEMITYRGGGFRPLPPLNLNTEDLTGGFVTGIDTTFVWGYRNTSGGAGAGLGLSDEPYNNPLPEGYFRLEFLTTGDTIVRTVNNISLGTYEYSNADRASDFGGNDFKVRVYNILNSLESEFDELEVEVV